MNLYAVMNKHHRLYGVGAIICNDKVEEVEALANKMDELISPSCAEAKVIVLFLM